MRPRTPIIVLAALVMSAWTYGPDMNTSRLDFFSVALSDGRIAAFGGTYDAPSSTNRAEGLTADAASWLPSEGSMAVGRRHFAGARLPVDRVLVVGGAGDGSTAAQASAEVWDPVPMAFMATGPVGVPRQSLAGAALPDGRVLATGGSADVTNGSGSETAELYD